MTVVLTPSESRIEILQERIDALESRIALIEGRLGSAAESAESVVAVATPAAGAAREEDDEAESFWDLSLIGRTLIILGGAYLIRALTQREVVPEALGMMLGLGYAVFWMFAAYRVAAESPWKATFEAGIATAIGFAIVIESATRFHILDTTAAAIVVFALTVAVLALAVWKNLQPTAWFGVVGSVVALSALAMATKSILAPAAAIFLVGAAASWSASRAGFPYLQWVPSVQANVLFIATPFVLGITGESRIAAIALLESAFVLTAIALFCVIALWKRTLTIFGFIYVSMLFAITIGGTAWLTRGVPGERLVLAIATAVAALFLWGAAAFRAGGEEETAKRNYPAIVGTLLTVAGTYLLIPLAFASAGWGVAATALAWFGRARPERSFSLHAALFGSSAAIGSGLIAFSLGRMLVPGSAAIAATEAIVVLLAVTAAAAMLAVRSDTTRSASRITLLALAVAGWCGVLAVAIATLLPADGAGAVGSVSRTVLFSSIAVGLALLGRAGVVADIRVLVNPLLLLIAAKFVVDDFRFGSAATLFVSLASFGLALVLCARLRKKRSGTRMAAAPVAGGL